MSLDKAIEHNKEKRQPYRGSKAIDKSCCNHGSCGWCRANRMYRTNKIIEKMNDIENEYNSEGEYWGEKPFFKGSIQELLDYIEKQREEQ